MKAGQFSDEQIVAVLQEAAKGEKTISVICQEKGISEATFYAWRKKFHGTSTKDEQKLRELEKENARLKKLLAEHIALNDWLPIWESDRLTFALPDMDNVNSTASDQGQIGA